MNKLSPTYCDLGQLEALGIYLAQRYHIDLSLEEKLDVVTLSYCKAKRSFNGKIAAFSTYLSHIILNDYFSLLRKKAKDKQRLVFTNKFPKLYKEEIDTDLIDVKDYILAIKSPRIRQISFFYFIESKTTEEIAKILGISRQRVRQIINQDLELCLSVA